MGKLTNFDRETIARRAANSAFPNSRDRFLMVEQDAMAREIYDALVPKKTREALSKLSGDWLNKESGFRFALPDDSCRHIHLLIDENGNWSTLPVKSTNILGKLELGDLVDRFVALEERITDAKAGHRELLLKVRAVLDSCSTFAKLRAVWPEGLEFYKDLDLDRPQLPMVNVSEINTILGLPREVAEAA